MSSRLIFLVATSLAVIAPAYSEASETVRIELTDSDEILEGRLVEHADTGFVVEIGDERRVVPFASVKRMSVMKVESKQGAAALAESSPAPVAAPEPEAEPSRVAPADQDPELEAENPGYSNAVSADIIRLLGSFALVSYERRLHERFGVALLAGLGGSDQTGNGGREFRDSWGVGLQARAYPVGSFRHGMSAGLEGYYWSGTRIDPSSIPERASSTSTKTLKLVGPFLGYRRISSIGLLVDATLGLSRDFEAADWRTSFHVNAGFAF